jgi:hypothetical protein
VGPRAGLDDVEKRKLLALPGLELRRLDRPAVASRYTDCAIPALDTTLCTLSIVMFLFETTFQRLDSVSVLR